MVGAQPGQRGSHLAADHPRHGLISRIGAGIDQPRDEIGFRVVIVLRRAGERLLPAPVAEQIDRPVAGIAQQPGGEGSPGGIEGGWPLPEN